MKNKFLNKRFIISNMLCAAGFVSCSNFQNSNNITLEEFDIEIEKIAKEINTAGKYKSFIFNEDDVVNRMLAIDDHFKENPDAWQDVKFNYIEELIFSNTSFQELNGILKDKLLDGAESNENFSITKLGVINKKDSVESLFKNNLKFEKVLSNNGISLYKHGDLWFYFVEGSIEPQFYKNLNRYFSQGGLSSELSVYASFAQFNEERSKVDWRYYWIDRIAQWTQGGEEQLEFLNAVIKVYARVCGNNIELYSIGEIPKIDILSLFGKCA